MPVALCTDDCGVFDTSLSMEFAIAAGAFELSEDQLLRLAEGAVEQSFAPKHVQQELLALFEDFRQAREHSFKPA